MRFHDEQPGKKETLEAILSFAVQPRAVPNLLETLRHVVRLSESLNWPDRQTLLVALIARLERARSPLVREFSDLSVYHLDAANEIRLRIALARSAVADKKRSKAENWLKLLNRLLPDVTDKETRSALLWSVAFPLQATHQNDAAIRALKDAAAEAVQIPFYMKRVMQLALIAGRQQSLRDAAGEIETDLMRLHEAQMNSSGPDYRLGQLTEDLLRLGKKPEARAAFDLLQRAHAAMQKANRGRSPYTADIARLEAEFAGTTPPSPPPLPQVHKPVVLSDALRIQDIGTKVEELYRYVFQLLAKHRLKQALQVLPLFPQADYSRDLVKQAIKL